MTTGVQPKTSWSTKNITDQKLHENLQNLHCVPHLILAVPRSIPDHPFTRG
jgi:hypothetical protein